jgi:hypothetical protein
MSGSPAGSRSDGGGGGNPCCAAARPVAAHPTYHLDTSAVAALVVTLLVTFLALHVIVKMMER